MTTTTCFSRTENMKVPKRIIDDLSNNKFNGEGETTLFVHTARFLKFCTKHNIHYEDVSCRFLILMFEVCIREWCYTLCTSSIHTFENIAKEIYHTFYRYDYKYVFKKIMRLWEEPHESLDDFHDHFIHFCFELFKDDVYWPLMRDKFEFLVHISMNSQEYESFESLRIYLNIRASKPVTDKVVVPSESLSPFN